jgi:hypothetical protein
MQAHRPSVAASAAVKVRRVMVVLCASVQFSGRGRWCRLERMRLIQMLSFAFVIWAASAVAQEKAVDPRLVSFRQQCEDRTITPFMRQNCASSGEMCLQLENAKSYCAKQAPIELEKQLQLEASQLQASAKAKADAARAADDEQRRQDERHRSEERELEIKQAQDKETVDGLVSKRSNPKTWAKSGWKSFRWGMGPGDVLLILGKPGPSDIGCKTFNTTDKGLMCTPEEEVLGRSVLLWFSFVNDSLVDITITPGELDGRSDDSDVRREQLGWFRRAATGLVAKYGKPIAKRSVDAALGAVLAGAATPRVTWSGSGTLVELVLETEQESGTDIGGDTETDWRSVALRPALKYSDAKANARQQAKEAKTDNANL